MRAKVKEIAMSVVENKLPYRDEFCDKVYCLAKDYITENYDLTAEVRGKEYDVVVKCTKRSISFETRAGSKIYSNSSLKDECLNEIDALVDKYKKQAVSEYFDTPGVDNLVKEMEAGNITMKQLQGDLSDLAVKAAKMVKEKVEEEIGRKLGEKVLKEALGEGVEKSGSLEITADTVTVPQNNLQLQINVTENNDGSRVVDSVILTVGDQQVDIKDCIAKLGADTWKKIWEVISKG